MNKNLKMGAKGRQESYMSPIRLDNSIFVGSILIGPAGEPLLIQHTTWLTINVITLKIKPCPMIKPNTIAKTNFVAWVLENCLNPVLLLWIKLFLKEVGQFLVAVFGLILELMTLTKKVTMYVLITCFHESWIFFLWLFFRGKKMSFRYK